MKPWERDWQGENQTSDKRPWEKDWGTPTTINASDYNGSIFIGQDGEDVKPFEKLNMFMDGFAKEENKESKSFGERWQDFSKNLLTVKVEPRSKELSPIQKAMEKTWQEGFSKVDWGEVGKSLGRGSLEFVKNATSDNLRIFADWYKSAVDDIEYLTPNEKKAITRNAENINKLADLIDKKIDLGLESDFLKPDEEVFRGEFEENPSMTRAISTIGSGLPSIVAGGAIYKITKSAVLTTAILSEIDAQDIYFGAREKGKTSGESLQLLGIGTAGTYFLEKVGLDTIFGKKGSPFAKRVVESVLSEGITEGGQTFWQNAVKKYGYDDTQRLLQGVLETSVGGALTGGVATTFMGNVYAARDSMKEKGATDTELDLLQEAMATELAKHADTIEPMFETNIQKSLDSLNAVIDSNIDKAEVEKAKKISQELTNISDKYYDMLKGKMPEAQAKSTSELLRNMAYFGSKMTGMSPAEFEQKEFPKIEWAKTIKSIQQKAEIKKLKKRRQSGAPSLLQFIRLSGGVIDEGGELKAMDAGETADTYIAFEPNQIKSTSNRGTYSESENIYYQSAFAGSRVDYDRPSLEAIGSGEGAQAHGWGLYYALNKDVAEDYRRSFISEAPSGVSVQEHKRLVLIKERGKEFFVNKLKEFINIKEKLNKAYTESDEIYRKIREVEAEEDRAYEAFLFEEETDARKEQKEKNRQKLKELRKEENDADNKIAEIEKEYNEKITEEKDITDFIYTIPNRYATEELQNAIKEVENADVSKIPQGQVHEVDLPENPYLLDEQKSYREQSDFVKQAIQEIDRELQYPERKEKIFDNKDDAIDFYDSKIDEFEEKANGYQRFFPESFVTDDGKYGVKYVDDYTINEPLIGDYSEITGEGIYSRIARQLGSQKAASELLEKHGVKGITYFGRQDGRCFVIFNPDDVKVIQKFYQNEQSPLGAFYNDTVYLFEKADASTIPHEMAHFWKKELRSFDNPQAKAMLEAADKWETAEFERLYKVIKRDNGYAVANKDGSIVYDKRGQGFTTEQDAISYAKEELFARGFERFLAEGKAPNNSMKQVFRNFLMWLHKKLKDAVSLNLNLSPDIKQVYSEILGGQDIDAFLNSEPDSFIQNRVKLSQERESFIDGEIEKAVATRSEKVKDKSGKGFSDLWANAMIPLSTRLERVSRKLRNKQRRYESDLALSLNKKYAQAKPFLDIWKNMDENDIVAFDLALKNDYVKKQLEIVDKYNARKEWEAVRKLLEDIFDEAVNAGLDIGYRPDYFPRKVKDVQGFLDYIRGSKDWTRFEEALRDADPDNLFTAEEQAEFLNKYLRGFVKVDLMPNKYGSEKERTIDVIDNELNRFYAPSIESLVSYIEGLNARIQASKFLGRDAENLEESIGGYLAYLLDNNIISPKQVDEVRDVLQARFGAKGVSNRFLRTGRDLSYIYTMGGINSAITQIDDLSVSIYKAGVWNTITAAFEAKKITRADLGLDNISAEFVDGSKTAKAVNKVFKLTGLDKIDAFAKNTLLNALMKKYQKMYNTDKAQLKALLEPVMEEETAQTMEDINNGELSDNVRYLLFSELSDVQPVSLSELPAFYNRGGNLRVLYMLKSFAIKRIDTYRNACFDKIRSKDWETRKEGVQNLFRLAAAMMVLGSAKDKIIDLLYGRNVDLTETMINNLLGLVGISKFQVYQARDKGLTSTVKDIIFPPLYSVIDDMIGDIWNVVNGKRELKDMEVLKGIPLVGRFYYWWIGRGKEKGKRRKKNY